MIQTTHFSDTAGVVGDRAVCVNGYSDTCCGQHTYSCQSDAIQTTYCISYEDTYTDQHDRDSCGFHTDCQTADDGSCGTCFRLVRDFLNGFVVTGSINFCDNTDDQTNDQTSDDSDGSVHVAKEYPAQSQRCDDHQHCGGVRTRFQGFMRIGVFVAFYKECTDDGSQNTNSCQNQREYSAFYRVVNDTQCDSRNDGTNIGFEQVGTHTSNVTYVVTYVVGDNGRVTRVVFRDTSFNFTYQVGTYVSSFCINTAANTAEQCDRGSTQTKTEQNVGVFCDHIHCAYTQQTQTNYGHTHNCAAAESDGQGSVHTANSRCVCSSYVCLGCNIHTEITSQCGESSTNDEADSCLPVYTETDQYKQYSRENNQNLIFCFQESVCAIANCRRDFMHTVCTFFFSAYLRSQDKGKEQRNDAQHRRQIHQIFHNNPPVS